MFLVTPLCRVFQELAIERQVDALEASAAELAESTDRDQLLVDVADLRHRLTDLHGQVRPAQVSPGSGRTGNYCSVRSSQRKVQVRGRGRARSGRLGSGRLETRPRRLQKHVFVCITASFDATSTVSLLAFMHIRLTLTIHDRIICMFYDIIMT